MTHVNSNNTAWHLDTRREKREKKKTGGIEVELVAQISRGVRGSPPLKKENKKTTNIRVLRRAAILPLIYIDKPHASAVLVAFNIGI